MKAALYTQYGPPEVLHLAETAKPSPQKNEILVRVLNSTVSAADCNMRGFVFIPPGLQFVARLMFGLNAPKKQILGAEFSGIVESVGSEVQQFTVGDAVFGFAGQGGYAEYLTISESAAVIKKPELLQFEEAAALPIAFTTAYYFLIEKAGLQAGEKILINGASGAVGSYAVQIAKNAGAHVSAVCSTANGTMVRDLGADVWIDYTAEDFTKRSAEYALVLDTTGKIPFERIKHCLTKNGRFIAVAGGIKEMLQSAFSSAKKQKIISGPAPDAKKYLEIAAKLFVAGKLRAVIDRMYALEEIAAAHTYVDMGRKKGNVVIKIG